MRVVKVKHKSFASRDMSGGFFYVIDEPTRILVADDDPIMREFASVYLSSPVADITLVCNGSEAIAALAGGSFDIMLLDIDMPIMNGFDVLQRLKADGVAPALPVVVITGREDIGSIDKAYALGATSFVSKPVNWRLLAYQVKYVLRSSRLAAQADRTSFVQPGTPFAA